MTAPLESVDVVRSRRFREGESFDEIAATDGITPRTAEDSIRQGHRVEMMRIQHQIMSLKLQGQLANEQMRQEIRTRLGPKVVDAMDGLLDGHRVEIWRDRKTGVIHTQTVYDPEVRLQGIEQYRKATSLEEKPAPPQTTLVNVQQNTTSISTRGYDFESRLRAIREKQKAAALPGEQERAMSSPGSRIEPTLDR